VPKEPPGADRKRRQNRESCFQTPKGPQNVSLCRFVRRNFVLTSFPPSFFSLPRFASMAVARLEPKLVSLLSLSFSHSSFFFFSILFPIPFFSLVSPSLTLPSDSPSISRDDPRPAAPPEVDNVSPGRPMLCWTTQRDSLSAHQPSESCVALVIGVLCRSSPIEAQLAFFRYLRIADITSSLVGIHGSPTGQRYLKISLSRAGITHLVLAMPPFFRGLWMSSGR